MRRVATFHPAALDPCRARFYGGFVRAPLRADPPARARRPCGRCGGVGTLACPDCTGTGRLPKGGYQRKNPPINAVRVIGAEEASGGGSVRARCQRCQPVSFGLLLQLTPTRQGAWEYILRTFTTTLMMSSGSSMGTHRGRRARRPPPAPAPCCVQREGGAMLQACPRHACRFQVDGHGAHLWLAALPCGTEAAGGQGDIRADGVYVRSKHAVLGGCHACHTSTAWQESRISSKRQAIRRALWCCSPEH